MKNKYKIVYTSLGICFIAIPPLVKPLVEDEIDKHHHIQERMIQGQNFKSHVESTFTSSSGINDNYYI